MNRIIESGSFDPFYNLALEEALFAVRREGVVLYLWQNRNTVVIGRNQNAWRECRTQLLESEGGTLARRSTGGGAVFHDLGNLNFSFFADKSVYDVRRQLSVLTRALASFGLDAEISGRNDVQLRATGEKISGNAFRLGAETCLHHGTVLVNADMERLARYLVPSKEKLAARGVSSVRARVTNLSEHAPQLTTESMKTAMRTAFTALYGPAEDMDERALDLRTLETLRARHASWDWRYGRAPAFDITLETRFPWGGAELMLSVEHGRVREAALYTDSMDAELSARVQAALIKAPCRADALAERLYALPDAQSADIAAWLRALSL